MSKLTERIIADAIQTIGVHEIGRSNSGPEVNQYLKFVGLSPGNPWCCAYVVYRVYKAAHEIGVDVGFKITGSCQVLYLWAKAKKLVHTVPVAGDVFLQWHSKLDRYAHAGFVRSISPTGKSFVTVEGNSNDDGSRDGYEVCSNTRKIVPGKYVFVTPQ